MKKLVALILAMMLAIGCISFASAEDEKVLKVGLASMSFQFDPGYSIGIQTIKVFYNIYDTLLTTSPEGEIVGQLAESWNWIDDKTLDVKIRPNVTFHNGEACTSEDVFFTFDRFLQGFGDGTVRVLYETLDKVEIIDELTVRFYLNRPDAAFENRLGSVWGANIVPKDYLEEIGAEAFQKAPIGTGPFKMEYAPEKLTLTAYEGFWGDKPNVDKIEMILYPEASARMIALINGEVDIINDVTADLVDTINSYDGISVQGTSIKNIHIYVFNVNNTDSIISNEKFRQALTMAMDRQALVEAFWGPYAFVPPGHQFPAYGDLYVDYAGIPYDIEKAKQLVAESGYDGEEITIEMKQGYYMNGDQAGEAICDMWREIGVNAKVVYKDKLTWDQYPHIRSWSSASRFDNPLGCLWLLFGPGSNPANSNWNPTEKFLQAGETLLNSKDVAEQQAAALAMLEEFDTVVPGTYLYMAEDLYGVRDGLNWNMHYCEAQIMPFRAADFSFAE